MLDAQAAFTIIVFSIAHATIKGASPLKTEVALLVNLGVIFKHAFYTVCQAPFHIRGSCFTNVVLFFTTPLPPTLRIKKQPTALYVHPSITKSA